ncbi:unnamed protein product [Nippostrongylus brasiliensis]|uniref:Peptidase A2 domain-containing protein n=1 Tax=Nippostrongylus brasiliensis TaxID=27835 RepID=A0A0N4XTR7_NIPBR|nr:unnamed protein product [Nippostrongylus brasiliensis]
MTTSLSTRQGLLTKMAGKLSALLDDAKEEVAIQLPRDEELKRTYLQEKKSRLTKIKKHIEGAATNVDKALRVYTETADALDSDTRQRQYILLLHSRAIGDIHKISYLMDARRGDARRCVRQFQISVRREADVQKINGFYMKSFPPSLIKWRSKEKPSTMWYSRNKFSPNSAKRFNEEEDDNESPPVEKENTDMEAVLCMKTTDIRTNARDCILVGQAHVLNKSSQTLETVHILLDTGADRSFIQEDLAKRLQLENIDTLQMTISTFGSEQPKATKCGIATLQIFDSVGQPHWFQVARIAHLTESLLRSKLSKEDQRYLAESDNKLLVSEHLPEVCSQFC